MQPRQISAFFIAFIFMVEFQLYYLWTSTPDLALNLYHVQYADRYLAYGVLWTWFNPNWWTDGLYKAELMAWVLVFAVFEYWLYKKKKLPKAVLVMSQFQNTIWFFVGGYQQITVNAMATLAFWNPLFAIPWALQKFPLGWSWNLSDSHWQCAFGNVVIGYVLKGTWYQGCGPGLFLGSIGLILWHAMELLWIVTAGFYWFYWRWKIPQRTFRFVKRKYFEFIDAVNGGESEHWDVGW